MMEANPPDEKELDKAKSLLESYSAATMVPRDFFYEVSFQAQVRMLGREIKQHPQIIGDTFESVMLFDSKMQRRWPHFGLPYGVSPKSLHKAMIDISVKIQVESWENEGGCCG